MSNEIEAVERAQAVSKGYEDGLALCKERPQSDLVYFIGFLPEKVSQAHIAIHLIEYYREGFIAAWKKMHDKPFNLRDEFIKDMNGPSSMEQAYMTDLEQS